MTSMLPPQNQTDVRPAERTTDEKLDHLRSAVKRQADAHHEPVGIMVGPDNFLATLGIGSLESAPVIVHEGCTIVSIDGSAPDVPIAGSRVWISTLSAVRMAAGLDYDDGDEWTDDEDWDSDDEATA